MSLALMFLAALVAALVIVEAYRKIVARGEDDFVHVSDPSGATIAKQERTAHTLQTLDRTRMILLIVTIVYAICVGAMYTYQSFIAQSTRLS